MADLILRNGKVWTVNRSQPVAQAVAVRQGRILAVGGNEEIDALRGKNTQVVDLKGRLMIYYGTADDNVHPNNAMQLIRALQVAGKSFDVQVGPDLGHTAVNQLRMMEFFIENLVMRKDATPE